MTESMSDEAFLQSALDGGASRSISDGTVPDRGYMVGGAKNLADQPFPEISHPVDSISVDHIRHHAREIRDHFGETPGIHQGAWKEGDQVVLDASQNVSHYSSAITQAKMTGERAVYDVRRGKERFTKDAVVKN